MLKTLAHVRLKQDRAAVIHLLEPPDDSRFIAGLKDFYQHKSDHSRRGIFSRLDGKYAEEGVDRYFLAVIDGKIAGALWYGYGRQNDSVANFGHVYTDPEFRGLGITPILLQYFKEDFLFSPVLAAFCTCSTEWIAKMYCAIGFVGIVPGTTAGRLMLPNGLASTDFEAFSSAYFHRDGPIEARLGLMTYRHVIDCLGAFNGRFSQRCFILSTVVDYQQAVFCKEDGCGQLLTWCDGRDHCFGWCLATDIAPDLRCFDYAVHENVTPSEEIRLVREALSRFQNTRPLLACVFAKQNQKRTILQECGFSECGELLEYLLLLREP